MVSGVFYASTAMPGVNVFILHFFGYLFFQRSICETAALMRNILPWQFGALLDNFLSWNCFCQILDSHRPSAYGEVNISDVGVIGRSKAIYFVFSSSFLHQRSLKRIIAAKPVAEKYLPGINCDILSRVWEILPIKVLSAHPRCLLAIQQHVSSLITLILTQSSVYFSFLTKSPAIQG
jgi:hypothetical protein